MHMTACHANNEEGIGPVVGSLPTSTEKPLNRVINEEGLGGSADRGCTPCTTERVISDRKQ